jgi:hypothetical protein
MGGCGKMGVFDNSDRKADNRVTQIAMAIKNNDAEKLKNLFSIKAISEADDIENQINELFNLIQGEVLSWERDGISGSTAVEYGKTSKMIRYSINLMTDIKTYRFYVIDYNTDTINLDNQGIYMLELIIYTEREDLDYWQNRMRAGIYIH